MAQPNRCVQLIERIFFAHYRPCDREVVFEREEIVEAARQLRLKLPKNLGDLIYSFRYRAALPERIRACAPRGLEWMIRPAGRARYRFVALPRVTIAPSPLAAETKVPDATPGIIARYALGDEQALLAKVRYNRLIDIFTGVACYSLQSHLRTAVSNCGQVETDEVYVGLDRRGAHYVFPVQAKGSKDTLNVVQIEQDFAMCAAKFPALVCRPIGTQFMGPDLIAMFAFEQAEESVRILCEKHYRLVPPDRLSPEDLKAYCNRQVEHFPL
ncbi:MAG: endonuclease [Planctomycetes bacterium]|nr:endonuclease [Planctomycetota bacterium]